LEVLKTISTVTSLTLSMERDPFSAKNQTL